MPTAAVGRAGLGGRVNRADLGPHLPGCLRLRGGGSFRGKYLFTSLLAGRT